MTMLLRGIWWRRTQALALLALGTVIVAGCLLAVTFSEVTRTPPGIAASLLLLGLVGLAAQAAGYSRSRSSELALAQLRGRTRLRVLAYFLAEPLVLLVLGAAAAVIIGRWLLDRSTRRWLGGLTPEAIGTAGWASVVISVVACALAVLAGSWRTVRAPVDRQLAAGYAPRARSSRAFLAQVVVLVAAAAASLQSLRAAPPRDDWSSLLAPAFLTPVLLGLAAGQLAVTALRALARWRAGSARTDRALASYLALRRLSRRDDALLTAGLVVAAATVAAVAVNAVSAVAAWREETTRLTFGAPVRYPVESGGLAAYQASREADPDGRWLMAAVSAPDESESYRRVFVDTARWNAVLGDFQDDTGAASLAELAPTLDGGEPVRPLVGETLSVDFDSAALRTARREQVTVNYLDDSGRLNAAVVAPRRPTPARPVTRVSTALAGCDRGCVVTQLLVESSRVPGRRGRVEIEGIRIGRGDVLAGARWVTFNGELRLLRSRPDGSLVVPSTTYEDVVDVVPDTARQRLAAVTTAGFRPHREGGDPVGYSVDGGEHPVSVEGIATSLPLVGRQGMLLDLPRALTSAGSTIPTADTYVLARADTPTDVLGRLEATGAVGEPRTYVSALKAASQDSRTQGARLHLLLSALAALVTMTVLVASVGRQRRERRDEAAGLRVVGVPVASLRSAYRREAIWLGATVLVAVVTAGWLAARITTTALALVPQTAYSPVLSSSPDPVRLSAVAVLAAVVTAVMTVAPVSRIARSSPPSVLRTDAR